LSLREEIEALAARPDATPAEVRPAAEPDGGTFRVWATEEGPPSHSVPPLSTSSPL
jgi:hypothetical protein